MSLKKKSKKAQINQVFIYVTASLIFIFILIMGYRMISSVIQNKENIEHLQLENDLKNQVESVRKQYGSKKKYDLNFAGYNKICFVDLEKSPPNSNNFKYPIMENIWQSGMKRNVFLVNFLSEYSFYIGNISLKNSTNSLNYTCLDLMQGENEIVLTSSGNNVLISKLN